MLIEVETDDEIYEVEAASDEEAREKVRHHLAKNQVSGQASLQPSQKSNSEPSTFQSLGNNISGFLEHNQLTAPFAHPLDLAQSVSNYLSPSDLAQDFATFGAPTPQNLAGRAVAQLGKEMFEGAGQASQRQFQRAMDKTESGLKGDFSDFATAPLNAALGVVGAFPLTSGIADAEANFEESKSGATGELLGEASNILLPFLPKVAKTGGGKLGASLETGAIDRYKSALNPKTKFEGLAEKTSKQALERGVWGSEKGLKKLSQGQVRELGAQLEEAYGKADSSGFKGSSVDVGKATAQSLDNLAAQQRFNGVQFDPAIEKAARNIKDMLEAAGELPSLEAWKLRQSLEGVAADKGAYMPGVDPALTANARASKAAADALRPALEKAAPETASLNKEYSFYRNLKESLKNKKKTGSQSGLVQTIRQNRSLTNKIVSAPLDLARSIYNSTTFRTGSAVLQYKLAKLLQAGKVTEALQTFKQLGASPDELESLKSFSEPDLNIRQDPQLAAPALDQPIGIGEQIFSGEIPDEFKIPGERPIAEAALELPFATEPDLAAFSEPQLPASALESRNSLLPNIYGDEIASNVLRERIMSNQVESLNGGSGPIRSPFRDYLTEDGPMPTFAPKINEDFRIRRSPFKQIDTVKVDGLELPVYEAKAEKVSSKYKGTPKDAIKERWEIRAVSDEEYAKADADPNYTPQEEPIAYIDAVSELAAEQAWAKMRNNGQLPRGASLSPPEAKPAFIRIKATPVE